MITIDDIKRYQSYLDKLADCDISSINEFVEDIEAFDNGNLSNNDIAELHKDLKEIELEFPDDNDYSYYPIELFDFYMKEFDSMEEVDKSTVRTSHVRQTVISGRNVGWDLVDEKLQSYTFKGTGYEVKVIDHPFFIGVANSKNGNFDDDYGIFPCSSYLALELIYENEIVLNPKEENLLLERILYFLSQKVGSAVYISEVLDLNNFTEELEIIEESIGEDTIEVSSLASYTPLTRLYSQALQSEDLEIKYLHFYKIIEYISPVVARMKAYESLNKKLDILATINRDYRYLDSIYETCRKYDEDLKDDFLCTSVVQTCIDVIPLWNYLPERIKKLYNGNLKLGNTNEVSETSFNDEKLRSYQKQLASTLYSTRNRIVHAKSNYKATDCEFSQGEMNEAIKIMEIIASSIIQWNERQSDVYKIKEG